MDGLEGLAPFVAFCVVAGTILLLAGNHRRARRESGATWLFAFGAAMVLIAVGTIVVYDLNRNTVQFRYTVTLTPDGSGSVRVSLPAPVDETLIANLAPVPGSSSVGMNRTGNEPSIEITLTERTTLTASYAAYRYAGPIDLTRADSMAACSDAVPGCVATVSVLVVSGDITAVHVVARASWSQFCYSPGWELDALALPGEREYPAMYPTIVC